MSVGVVMQSPNCSVLFLLYCLTKVLFWMIEFSVHKIEKYNLTHAPTVSISISLIDNKHIYIHALKKNTINTIIKSMIISNIHYMYQECIVYFKFYFDFIPYSMISHSWNEIGIPIFTTVVLYYLINIFL